MFIEFLLLLFLRLETISHDAIAKNCLAIENSRTTSKVIVQNSFDFPFSSS